MRISALPVLSTLLGLLPSRTLLHLEFLALRQQLAMVNQTPRKRLRFHWGQRLFWIWLYRLWPGCLQTLQGLPLCQDIAIEVYLNPEKKQSKTEEKKAA